MADDLALLIERLRLLHERGQGVQSIYVVSPADDIELLAAALSGQPEAMGLLEGIAHTMHEIRQRRPAALCLCCPKEIRTPKGVTFVFMSPDMPIRDAVGMAICPPCGRAPDLNARIVSALRQYIWPEARVLDVHPVTGTA